MTRLTGGMCQKRTDSRVNNSLILHHNRKFLIKHAMNTSNGHQIHLINNNTEKVFQQPRESNRKIENVLMNLPKIKYKNVFEA